MSNQCTATGSPAVSVIIPTRDYARFLPAAIGSLSAQTFQDWECIVVDDGSTDETEEVLHRLTNQEPRLIYVRQRASGVSAARNEGLRKARGEFIQFLDADDLLAPNKIETHVNALRSDAEAAIVYGQSRYFDDGAPTILRMRPRDDPTATGNVVDRPGTVTLSQLVETNPMTIEAALARKSVLDRVGGFDESLERMEDWDLWLRCAMTGARVNFVEADDAMVLVRVHASSASYEMTPMLVSMIAVRQKIGGMLTSRDDRSLNSRRLDELRAHVGLLIGMSGDPIAGLRYVVPAIGSGRRPRGLRTAVGLIAELTGVPRLVRGTRAMLGMHGRRSSRDPSPPDRT